MSVPKPAERPSVLFASVLLVAGGVGNLLVTAVDVALLLGIAGVPMVEHPGLASEPGYYIQGPGFALVCMVPTALWGLVVGLCALVGASLLFRGRAMPVAIIAVWLSVCNAAAHGLVALAAFGGIRGSLAMAAAVAVPLAIAAYTSVVVFRAWSPTEGEEDHGFLP